jgi:NADH-quinone oxidoreductase subunit G
MLQLHKSQENPYIDKLYSELLEAPNSHVAHELLHTGYSPKKRIQNTDVKIMGVEGALEITICFGTSCFIRGSQKVMKQLGEYVKGNSLENQVDIKATFCHERCQRGPVVSVGGKMIEKATIEKVIEALEEKLAMVGDAV